MSTDTKALDQNHPPSQMGNTTIRLPFGACASTDPFKVRKPQILPWLILVLFIVAIAFLVRAVE